MQKLEQQASQPKEAISRLEQKGDSLKTDFYKELGELREAIKEMGKKVGQPKEGSSAESPKEPPQ